MNNISTVLPMISIEIDPAAAAPQSEPNESSADDFASMLASMCTPLQNQPLMPLTREAEPETTNLAVAGECLPGQPDVAGLPVDQKQPVDAGVPQPILTFENTESTPAESVTKKIALPDISLPMPKQKPSEESKEIETIALNQTPAVQATQSAPTPVTVGEQLSPVMPGFVRTPLTETDPVAPKVNVPVRQPPTFIVPKTTAETPVGNPEVSPADIKVPVSKYELVDTSNPAPAQAPAPDQVTAEAIKREANLAASYLAQSTRDGRESAFEAIKTQVSGNGPDARSNDSNGDGNSTAKNGTMNVSFGSVNFTSALKNHSIDTIKEIAGPQVANQIVDLAAATQPRQQRTVRLRLRPEELGQVDIQLSRDAAGKVSAQVVVERESARAALSQSLPQLRETLERAGLSVDQLNVSSDASSFAGNTRDNHQSTGESQRSFGNTTSTSTSTAEAQSKERVREHKLLSLSA